MEDLLILGRTAGCVWVEGKKLERESGRFWNKFINKKRGKELRKRGEELQHYGDNIREKVKKISVETESDWLVAVKNVYGRKIKMEFNFGWDKEKDKRTCECILKTGEVFKS